MKFLLIFLIAFFSSFSFGWTCHASVSQLTDPSTRLKCMSRMLQHWTERAHIELLTIYKTKLATSELLASEHQFRQHNNQAKIIDELIKYEQLRKLMFPPNAQPINLTCSSGSDTSD